MIQEEQKNRILSRLDEKKIKSEYKKSIIKYIELNNDLFPFLNKEELINRILENLNKISLNVTSALYNDYGQYIPTTGKILLSPNLYIGKNKKYKESVFLHELDHCACAPVEVRNKYREYKNEIHKKYKLIYRIIPDVVLNEIFLKIHYEGPLSGIANLESKRENTIQKISYGTNVQNYLNEGITSLKQKIYSEQLKIDFHKKKDFLFTARKAAECLTNVIGIENVIYYHFYNNFEKIEEKFFEKTNIKLENLIYKCISYDRSSSKKKLKDLNNFIEQIYMSLNRWKNVRN